MEYVHKFYDSFDENTRFGINLGIYLFSTYLIFLILRKLCTRKKIVRRVVKKVEKNENTNEKYLNDQTASGEIVKED
jgi:hypothetical protein